EEEVDFLLAQLEGRKEVKIVSIFSHLGASEDLNEKEFTNSQIRSFERISAKMLSNLQHTPLRHLLNTSGIINYAEAQFDMVRSGIGLCGYGNEASEDQRLIPVAT